MAVSGVALAQAPAGSTGQCKDGSYTNTAKKDGACRGHKGVQTWYAASAAPAPAAPASQPAPAAPAARPSAATPAAPAAAPSQPAASASTTKRKSPEQVAAARTQAPGGGPGLVWVNTSTKVYHCPGTEFYGKTKDGKYMSETDAKGMGAHADHEKTCTK